MASEMEDKATPRPWRVKTHGLWWSVEGDGGEEAFDDGTAGDEYSPSCSPETRDLILKAVNSYDAHREIAKAAKRVLAAQIEIYQDQGWSIGTDITDLQQALRDLDEVEL